MSYPQLRKELRFFPNCDSNVAKDSQAMVTPDYRPTYMLYKLFAYLVLGRIKYTLDSAQPDVG